MKIQKYDYLIKNENPTIFMTSFIDVLFVLLIFFMVTTDFSDIKNGINILLPKTNITEIPDKRDIIISITKEGETFLNSDRVSLAVLEDRIMAQIRKLKKTNVIIQADEKTEHGAVVKVMAIARNAGATEINIATDEEK